MKMTYSSFMFLITMVQEKGKVRSVLLLQMTKSGMKVFRITSKYSTKSAKIQKRYYEIQDWKEAGLDRPSWIDIGEAACFNLENLHPKRIGALSEKDINSLAAFIENYDY
ncbi:hypothetical protein [Enterococcus sp. DIV0756]|uniref:hypothetical protein n=1 Tax=Enterococcus sp. DIV0756 TaxID=2774636 RepID=UPI003F29ED94